MPIVNGNMYAEARREPLSFTVLNVLILGNNNNSANGFIDKLQVLHEYIESTPFTNVKVIVHCTNAYNTNIANAFGVLIHDITYQEESVKNFANTNNIDIVVDQDNILSLNFGYSNFYSFELLKTIDEAISSIEAFLLGNGIIWLFKSITWNLPLHMRYYDRPGICMDFYNFMMQCAESSNYTSDQQEKVRYIANKISHVEYAKDTINYYIQRLRYAERNGYNQQGFHIELNYHIGNYYFLLSGVLDSTARLLNDVLRLNLGNPMSLGLEKDDFIKAHRKRRSGYVRLLKNKEFVNWITFLKKRRNFIAHDGDMRQSPLVEQNSVLLTDEEVGRLVDLQLDWTYARSVSGDDVVNALREHISQIVRLQNDYTEVARDIMIVPDKSGKKIYHPLRSVEYDYGELRKIMTLILNKLKNVH